MRFAARSGALKSSVSGFSGWHVTCSARDCFAPGLTNGVMSASPPGKTTDAASRPSTYTTARVARPVNVTRTRFPAADSGIVKSRRYQTSSARFAFTPWSSNQGDSHVSWSPGWDVRTDGTLPQPQLSPAPGTAPAVSFVSAGRSPHRPFRHQRVRVAVDSFHAPSRLHGSAGAPSGSGALHGSFARFRFTSSTSGPYSATPSVPKLCCANVSFTAPSGIGKSRTQSVHSVVPWKPKTFGQPPTIFPSARWKDIGMRPSIHPSFPRTSPIVFMRVRSVSTPHSGRSGTL